MDTGSASQGHTSQVVGTGPGKAGIPREAPNSDNSGTELPLLL